MWGALQLQTTRGLVSKMIRYTIDTSNEKETDSGQKHLSRSVQPGDGACDNMSPCRVRNDNNAGLQEIYEKWRQRALM
jgi:hypothetical protein